MMCIHKVQLKKTKNLHLVQQFYIINLTSEMTHIYILDVLDPGELEFSIEDSWLMMTINKEFKMLVRGPTASTKPLGGLRLENSDSQGLKISRS